jgi:TolB-like protein
LAGQSRLDLNVSDLGATTQNIAQPVRAYLLEVGAPAQAKPMTTTAKPRQPARVDRRSRLALLGAAIAALLILVAAGRLKCSRRGQFATVATSPTPEAARRSIVVLPFNNLSGDPAQDYLADALTDQLTTALARIGAFVIARNTAFTYKGKPVDAKAIGKELGVRYMMEGSVMPTGNQLRVNAQLIDADSGGHLWPISSTPLAPIYC